MMLKRMFEDMERKKEKAFMAHVYCGDPSVGFSEKVIHELEESIDILELGIPFSDPLADGRVFQQVCQSFGTRKYIFVKLVFILFR